MADEEAEQEAEVAALVSEAEAMALEASAALKVESESEAAAPEAVMVPGVKAEVAPGAPAEVAPEVEVAPEAEAPEAEASEPGPKVVEHTGPLRNLRGVKAEQAVCLSLAGSGLSSLHGIAAFKQLWTLDLSTCGIQSVEPLLPLGSLGQLDLAGNLLDLPSALRLRKMRLGQLVLRGNPLLPTALSVGGESEDSLLLRSVLVDALPCMLALDGSFVSSAERLHCRAYIESSQGQADWQQLLRMELVSQPAARSSSQAAVGTGGTGSTDSVDGADSAGSAPQAAALGALFEASEQLLQMESEARNRADLKRLKWLAADFDATAMLLHEHHVATEPGEAEEEAADEPTAESGPLQLCSLAQQGWLKGGRRIGLMSLLAYSLQQLVPGRLVHEALKALLCEDGGELPAEHVALLFSLPPCMRAALLVSLARRPIENGREASASLWRYLSIEAPLGSAAAAPNAAAAAAILAGQRACGSHLGRILVGLPSWAAHAHEVPELVPPPRVSPPASPTRRRYVPPPASPQHPTSPLLAPATPKTPQLWPAAPSTPQRFDGSDLPYEVPRPAMTTWSSHPDTTPWPSTPGPGGRHPTPAPAPAFAPWPGAVAPPTPAGEAVAAPVATATPAPAFVPPPAPPPVPAPRPPRPPERSEKQVAVAHASDVWYLDPTPPQPLPEQPPAVAGVGVGGRGRAGAVRAESNAGIHADNLSWGASFLLATSGAAAHAGPPRRTGGGSAAASVLGWSQLEAPAYLYELPHRQFVHVQYAEPPRPKRLVSGTARAPQPRAGHAHAPPPPPPQLSVDARDAPAASLPVQAGDEEGRRAVEGGPLPTSDYTGLNEGVYCVQPSLGASASAPVLPSELPAAEGAAPAGGASSCDLHTWSLTGVSEQAAGAGACVLPPGAAALEPPAPAQDPAYASRGAAIVGRVADGYVLSLQEQAELRELAARGGGPPRQRTRGKDGSRAPSAVEPRTFALQAALLGGKEEIPGKSWFAVPGKGTFLLSQVNGAPSLGGGAPSRGRRAVDVRRREVEAQAAQARALHRQSLQKLDLIRDGSWARSRTQAHQQQFTKPVGLPPRRAAPLGSRKQPPSSARLLPVRNRPDVELATATLTTAASAPLLEGPSSSSSSKRGSAVLASRLANGSTGPLPAVTTVGGN